MTKLLLETDIKWKCPKCSHIRDYIDDEEWPSHCEVLMQYHPVYWFELEKQ